MTAPGPKLDLLDWRRRVAEMYAAVRAQADPAIGHQVWQARRDVLLRTHPQSPLKPADPMRDSGVPVWPYDPALRWELALEPVEEAPLRLVDSANDGEIRMRLVGRVTLPDPVGGTLDAWWLEQYGGGLFVPLKDGTAGRTTYGAGRYLLDTAKGADLGGSEGRIVVDLNFAYHPSCRYDDKWQCPLAPPGNTIGFAVEAGERLSAD
jgi:uncharacterized protein (DUF1684 family)